MSIDALFNPIDLGAIRIENRIVMAPMTRSRADRNGQATDSMATYYEQRASAGMIITEGVYPSAIGKGYLGTPGMYRAEHAQSWQKVTQAVHAKGSKIVMQMMHAGRISHESLLDGQLPVAPSAVTANGLAWTMKGQLPHPTPRELTKADIVQTIEDFVASAKFAIEAGFDGVELHNASGYLPHQFLSSNVNLRTDEYGGSATNRTRFSLELLEALGAAIGIERVGIKLSPEMTFNDIQEDESQEVYRALVSRLPQKMAYLHVMRAQWSVNYHEMLKSLFKGAYLAGGGLTRDEAIQMRQNQQADGLVFGNAFIANPDLPIRLKLNAPLNEVKTNFLYTGGSQGYTDYPTMI